MTPRVEEHGAMRMTIAYEPTDPRKMQDAIMILAAMLKGMKGPEPSTSTEQN